MTFLYMKWVEQEHVTVRLLIGEPEIIKRDVKHTRIILKLIKFD